MTRKITLLIIFGINFLFFSICKADSWLQNTSFIVTSKWGSCYAKSIPDEDFGIKGKTFIFKAEKEKDTLIDQYDWYSRSLYLLEGSQGVLVVRLFYTPAGHTLKDLNAIAFFRGGKLLREYTVLDIISDPKKIIHSTSSIHIFDKIHGFEWDENKNFVFVVETVDGRTLFFDTDTGEMRLKNKERN